MKKYLLPLGAGVVVFGVVTAFAATLNVSSTTLGAGNALVNSCQSDAAVTYNHTSSAVDAAVVTFSGGSDNCSGLTAEVTLTGDSGTLATESHAVVSEVATVDFSADSIDAADVTGVSVVITG